MIIPTLCVRDIDEAVDFMSDVLDFECASRWPRTKSFYAVMMRGDDELHLQLIQPTSRKGCCAVTVVCDDVDERWEAFKARGLVVPVRPESPVHEGPVDQTWGTREFYVDDPSGNTVVYQQRVEAGAE